MSKSAFQDLGFEQEEAANLELRSLLMMRLEQWYGDSSLTQAAAAKAMGLTQPRFNRLLKGKIGEFSLDALVNMATRAGLRVGLTVKPMRRARSVEWGGGVRPEARRMIDVALQQVENLHGTRDFHVPDSASKLLIDIADAVGEGEPIPYVYRDYLKTALKKAALAAPAAMGTTLADELGLKLKGRPATDNPWYVHKEYRKRRKENPGKSHEEIIHDISSDLSIGDSTVRDQLIKCAKALPALTLRGIYHGNGCAPDEQTGESFDAEISEWVRELNAFTKSAI